MQRAPNFAWTRKRKLAHGLGARYNGRAMKGHLVILLCGTVAAGALAYRHRAVPAMSASITGGRLSAPARESVLPKTTPRTAAPSLDLANLVRQGDVMVAFDNDNRSTELTLDPELQELAEDLLRRAQAPKGAIVAMRPDGTIVALAGATRANAVYDERPRKNRGATGAPEPQPENDETADFEELAEQAELAAGNETAEMVFDGNLANAVWAPAASVFKVVTATALVANGYGPTTRVCFHGGVRSVTADNLVDSKRDGRCEDLTHGVAFSQNAIMGKLAYQHTTPSDLSKWARRLGLEPIATSELGGLGGELDLAPTRDLTMARNAAGFSGSRMSALGGAILANTIATRGIRVVPHISRSAAAQASHGRGERILAPHLADQVATMMAATCKVGSAAKSFARNPQFPSAIDVAGKTGTLTGTGARPLHYSLFVGFAPVDAPAITISVILGNSANWRMKAHMIASEMVARALARPAAKVAMRPQRR